MDRKINRTTQPIRKEAERDAMKAYLRKRSLRDHALFVLGVYIGRRVSDLVAMNVSDVAYIDKRGYFRIVDFVRMWERKTGKFIELEVHPDAIDALGKYLSERRKNAQSDEAVLNEPLFKSQKAKSDDRSEYRITTRQALNILSGAARACGLNYKVGTHSLRKTFGYCLHQDGVDIELIQRLLNHSSPEITLSYIGITQDDMNEAISNLRMFSTSKRKRKTPPRRSKSPVSVFGEPDEEANQ